MIEWIRSHEVLLWWLAVISVVTFVGTLLALPLVVARIPADYFSRPPRSSRATGRHPLLRLLGAIGKNLAGVLFVLAGIAMLFLPGQGILTIVIGILLMDFPGKFALERWLIRRPAVRRGIDWLRGKAGRPPLDVPGHSHALAASDTTDGEET